MSRTIYFQALYDVLHQLQDTHPGVSGFLRLLEQGRLNNEMIVRLSEILQESIDSVTKENTQIQQHLQDAYVHLQKLKEEIDSDQEYEIDLHNL